MSPTYYSSFGSDLTRAFSSTGVSKPSPEAIANFTKPVPTVSVAVPVCDDQTGDIVWTVANIEAGVAAGTGSGSVIDVGRVGWRGDPTSYAEGVDLAVAWCKSERHEIETDLGSPINPLISSDFIIGAKSGWVNKFFAGAAAAVLLTAQYGYPIDDRVVIITGELRLQDGRLMSRYGSSPQVIPSVDSLVGATSQFDRVMISEEDEALVNVIRSRGHVGVTTFTPKVLELVRALWRGAGASTAAHSP